MGRDFQEIEAEFAAEIGENPPRDDRGQWVPVGQFSEDPEPARTSRFFSAADLAGVPMQEREFHVPELVPSRTVTMLNGDGGTGKSTLAMQLAVSTVPRSGCLTTARS